MNEESVKNDDCAKTGVSFYLSAIHLRPLRGRVSNGERFSINVRPFQGRKYNGWWFYKRLTYAGSRIL